MDDAHARTHTHAHTKRRGKLLNRAPPLITRMVLVELKNKRGILLAHVNAERRK